MAFIRERKIGEHVYVYRETRWREGKKVRSRSDYLGRLNDWLHDNITPEKGEYMAEKMAKQYGPKEKPASEAEKEKAAPEDGSSPAKSDDVPSGD